MHGFFLLMKKVRKEFEKVKEEARLMDLVEEKWKIINISMKSLMIKP